MAKDKKLNSMRILEKAEIPYEVFEYDDSERNAEVVAELIGVLPEMVYKTLVVHPVGSNKPFLVMLACNRQLDLKRMAAAAGEKKVQMAAHADAEKWTGLKVGGISALMLMDKHWQVYLDSPAAELQNIFISAGQKGMQLRLPVLPLMKLLRAKLVDVSRDKEE